MYVNINYGVHHNNEIKGVFPVHKAYNAKAGHVIIKVPALNDTFPRTLKPRVKCEEDQFFYCDEAGNKLENVEKEVAEFKYSKSEVASDPGEVSRDAEMEFLDSESEEDAMGRIKGTFEMLERMTRAAVRGTVRGLVVSGPPGIGKSFEVETVLEEHNDKHLAVRTMAGAENPADMYEVVKGSASALHLYMRLYMNRSKGQVLVLDDSDTILFDEESLNLLKSALDSGKKRRLSYLKESSRLIEEEIPNQFEFNGSVIFLTNLDFELTKNGKIKTHLEAIMSRCHYLDLAISHQRDKILRIKQIVNDGMLDSYRFTENEDDMIVNYIEDNQDYLRELSLRMVIKIAELVKADPINWELDVESTCLRREAKFRRLLDQAQS